MSNAGVSPEARDAQASWASVAKREVLRKARFSARRRGIEWLLSDAEWEEIAQGECEYCGIGPSNLGGGYLHNGSDRVDSGVGYLPGNCVPCCKRCNTAKGDASVGVFRAWIIRLAQHSTPTI